MTKQRRTVGVVAAVILAILGTLGLVAYVESAKDDAVAGERLVKVYVATGAIDAGTPAGQLETMVRTEKVPAKVQAADAITTLKDVSGRVTSTDIVSGEQLVASRFVPPAALLAGKSTKGVPAGLFGGTVSLEPEQALGGQVLAGDRVAVVGMTDTNSSDAAKATVIARNVLVTSVQIDGSTGEGPEKKQVTEAPTGKFFVTLALTQADLEKVVTAANAGTVWLATDAGAQ